MTSLRLLRGARILVTTVVYGLTSFGFLAGASAESPSLSSITPAGAMRGTEVEVRIGGQNLADNPQLLLYGPGITVKEIGPYTDKKGVVSDNSVVAKLAIAADCPLGPHPFRVRTDSGLTLMPRLFMVGHLPETEEVEPNNLPEQSQTIPLNTTVSGTVGNEDIDYYLVDLKQGERLNVEVEGMRLGRTLFDPFIAVYDESNNQLARSDDEAFGWYDAVTSIVAPKTGKYRVQVRESTYLGGGAAYRMHIGGFPRPTAMIPAGGKPGEKLEVTYYGDATGPWKETISVPKTPVFYSTFNPGDQKGTALFPKDKSGMAPTPLIFRINDLGNVIEKEPNDTPETATPGPGPMTAYNGCIEKPGDVDHFVLTLPKGQAFDVRVHGRSIRSPLDSMLTITRQKGNSSLGSNDDSGTPDSYLRVTGNDEPIVVQVKDMLGQGGANYVYRVEVTPVEPSIGFTAAEKIQYVDTICYVPQGNRGAVLLNASKRDFNADLELIIKNLPKGMKYETMPLAATQTSVPLLLTADDNAAPSGGALDITVKSLDTTKVAAVAGHFSQASWLLSSNNRAVYTHTIQGLSTAIIKKVPFKIEVETPKVPLVRNGNMELKVRAIREPGFTAPIAIKMLYNPNGTASAVSAQIPEGKNEGLLYINAGATAEMRQYKIVVLGSAPVGKGSIEVASPMISIDIGEPYFDLAFKAGAVEQGKEFQLTVPANNIVEFKGKAKLQLIGLPDEATCEPIEITQDDTQAVFTVKTTAKTPVGRHKSIMCNLVVMKNGEAINHTLGPGEIRVDPPTRTRPLASAAGANPQTSGNAPANAKPGESAKPVTNANNNK